MPIINTAFNGGSSLPDQTGQNGKFLTTNGTSASWGTVESLPSQTGQSGKFLTTDGTSASWSDKPLVNNATPNTSSLAIGDDSVASIGASAGSNVAIGPKSKASGANNANGKGNVAVGYQAQAGSFVDSTYNGGIAIGNGATVRANNAILLAANTSGFKYNDTANTFMVANANGNFEIMSADGTMPTDRFTTTPSADGTYVPTLTISSGVASRSWSAPGGGGSTGTTATLAVADWSNNTQTVNVTGVTASNNVIVAAAPASQSDYTTAGILCTAQGAGTLSFSCVQTPTSAITVNVLILA